MNSIPIGFARQEKARERLRSIMAIATMFLTDDEVGALATFIEGHTAPNIRDALLSASPPEEQRVLILARSLFKDAPFATYAAAILVMIARDFKANKGAITPEEISEGLKQFGIETEPSVWEGVRDEGTLEGLSNWLASTASPFLREWGPLIAGAVGLYASGPAGAAGAYAGAKGLLSPGAAPQLPK